MNLGRSRSTLPIILSFAFCTQVFGQTIERPECKLGDTWTYRYRQGSTSGSPGTFQYIETSIVTKVSAEGYELSSVTIAERDGERKTSTARRSRDINYYVRPTPDAPMQEVKTWQWPLETGRTWRYEVPGAEGSQIWEVRVKGWEEVEVPAGKFKTLRVDREMISGVNSQFYRRVTMWVSPEAKVSVKTQEWGIYEGFAGIVNDSRELEIYQVHCLS